MENKNQYIKNLLFGVAVGDAIGVPIEFMSREQIRSKPLTDMIGYGTYNLPAGTWSDDSSLTFCLAEALATESEFDLQTVANNFIAWYKNNFWTPHGDVFDIGIATREAINRLIKGHKPELAGGMDVHSNGNGSLMRILPLLIHIKDMPIEERFHITKNVSSITHGHIRSVIACFYYLEFAKLLLDSGNKFTAYNQLKNVLPTYLRSASINKNEINHFNRLLVYDIHELEEDEINSSGYVVHTLEASIWCLLKTNSYRDAVLTAANLGEDTDTTAAVTGGLAGLLYGYENIPKDWVEKLARKNDIEDLGGRLMMK